MNVKDEIESKKPGQCITEVSYAELQELINQLLDSSFDLDALCESECKADRVRARKLLMVEQLIADSPVHLIKLNKLQWSKLYFVSLGNGEIDVQVKATRQELTVKSGKYKGEK
jgi:hypothetical protein